MELIDFPDFSSEDEAKVSLNAIAQDSEELMYEGSSMRGFQRSRASGIVSLVNVSEYQKAMTYGMT